MIELAIGIIALLIIAGLGFPLGFSLLFVGVTGFAILHPRGLDATSTVAGQQIPLHQLSLIKIIELQDHKSV